MPHELTAEDRTTLARLEEAMWREKPRFRAEFMEQVLAPDFVEFGRSGRAYSRREALAASRQPIDALLPLPNLALRLLDEHTVLLTYDSVASRGGVREHAHRSSIWSRTRDGWVMRFHQGTPFEPGAGR
jgi:hypothetical protein